MYIVLENVVGCDIDRAKSICYTHIHKLKTYVTLHFIEEEYMGKQPPIDNSGRKNIVVFWMKNGYVHKPAKFYVDCSLDNEDEDSANEEKYSYFE